MNSDSAGAKPADKASPAAEPDSPPAPMDLAPAGGGPKVTRQTSQKKRVSVSDALDSHKKPVLARNNNSLKLSVFRPNPELANRPDWKNRIATFVDSFPVQTVLIINLFVALFITDSVALSHPANSVDDAVDGVLFTCFLLFLFEMCLNLLSKPSYLWSFFFWMDLLGTLSILTELSWTADAIGLNQRDSSSSLMRASRTSRVGARAGRLSKLAYFVKVLRIARFMKIVGLTAKKRMKKQAAAVSDDTAFGEKLSEAMSKQVAALTLVCILLSPLLSFSRDDSVAASYVDTFDFLHTRGSTPEALNDLADAMNAYMRQGYQRPCELTVGEREWVFRAVPSYNGDRLELSEGEIKLVLDITTENDEESAFSIGLMCFVIVILIAFSTLLNGTCNKLVVVPLERIFSSIQSNATTLFESMSIEMDEDDEEADELNTIESIIKKMSKLVQHVASSKGQKLQAILDDKNLDDSSKQYMLDMNHRLLPGQAEGGGPPSPNGASEGKNSSKPKLPGLPEGKNSSNGAILSPIDHPNLPLGVPLGAESGKASKLFKQVASPRAVDSWDFDVFALGHEELFTYVHLMFANLGLMDEHKLVPAAALRALLELYVDNHHPNPYHCFEHVIDVTHTVYRLIILTQEECDLTTNEKLALMVGALSHDLQHPGQNNVFLINTKHELALTYNDASVLENSHVARLYNIVSIRPECNVFANLDKKSWWEVRAKIVAMVLHTDMTKHFDMVSKCEVLLELKGDLTGIMEGQDDRQFVLNLLLHASDISNSCKPWPQCSTWANRVMTEFFNQGDKEKAAAMPVSPMMDRDTTSTPLTQVNFIEFVVAPLFGQISKLIPPATELLTNLMANRRTWGEKYGHEVDADPSKSEEVKAEEKGKVSNRTDGFFAKYEKLLKDEEARRNPQAVAEQEEEDGEYEEEE